MIRRDGNRQYGQSLLVDRLDGTGTLRLLDRIPLFDASEAGVGRHDESWLQTLIHRFPQILPVAEIEPGLADAGAVCMEMPTSAGFVDNLLMTARGDLVLVECKLWRNPEARRQVVAQIIDYAASMASWSYQDLEEAVAQAFVLDIGRPTDSLYEIVGAEQEVTEEVFIDAVSRNLRLGRALLLIVGDGIREGVETLVDHLQGHAGFHFTLGLVELPVYRMPEGAGYVVQGRVLARTVNIERAIVRIEDGRPVASAVPAAPGAPPGRRPVSITEERLYEGLAEHEPSIPERLRSFLVRAAEYGVSPDYGQSLMLKWRNQQGTTFNLGCIYPNGEVRTDPVNWKPDQIGRIELAHDYLERLAALAHGEVRKTPTPTSWYVTSHGVQPKIGALLAAPEEWLAAIEHYTTELERAVQADEDVADDAPPA